MELKVTGCSDCPFLNTVFTYARGYEYSCNHPADKGSEIDVFCSGEDLSYIEVPATPESCPLTEPITITKE